MARIEVVTQIAAPPETCFDLARDIDLHTRSLAGSGEKAVAGVTRGLIGPGEEVTFQGRHFGVTLRHTSRITAFDRPQMFRDEMVRGQFRSFVHLHLFEPEDGGTKMTDRVEFIAPLGPLGRFAELLFLRRYLETLLRERGRAVQEAAEGNRAAV